MLFLHLALTLALALPLRWRLNRRDLKHNSSRRRLTVALIVQLSPHRILQPTAHLVPGRRNP